MNTVEQGRLGEAAIVKELLSQGYDVFLPMFGNAYCDMVVCKDGVLQRVESKSTKTRLPSGSWIAQLRQVRHNTKKTTVKNFDAGNSEVLAIYIVPEDRVVLLPSKDHHGKTAVTVK